MAVNVNAIEARNSFKNAKAKLVANNIDVDKAVLSPGFLQFSVELTQNATQFSFPILQNSSTPNSLTQSPTDVRLRLQDAFFISQMGLFLQIPTTTDGVTQSQYSNLLMRFPSGYFWPDFNFLIMRTIWNASLQFSVNNEIIIPFWDTERHLNVPQTQYPIFNGATPISAFYPSQDQVDASTDGYFPMEPNIILWGSGNNSITLNLPNSLNTTGAAWTGSYKPRIVLKVRGVLAQNCTAVAVTATKPAAGRRG